MDKYQVYFDGRKFHLSEDGKITFCGKQIPTGAARWTQDQPATIKEFVDEVRPRCSSCKANSEISIAIDLIVEYLKEE